jgi:uncharacterized surface protein with fasciclin (FAS1) repeats
MQLRRLSSTLTALAVAATAAVATTAPAQAGDRGHEGSRSLAAVLAEKPRSMVRVLAKGNVRLTAFAPTDGAFRRLVLDLTGTRYASERRVFRTVAGLGVDTVETVLLYHVVPGATITYKQARAAGGARLETALDDATLKVRVRHGRVTLVDADRNDPSASVLPRLRDINAGNKQIAHGINAVLRPADL